MVSKYFTLLCFLEKHIATIVMIWKKIGLIFLHKKYTIYLVLKVVFLCGSQNHEPGLAQKNLIYSWYICKSPHILMGCCCFGSIHMDWLYLMTCYLQYICVLYCKWSFGERDVFRDLPEALWWLPKATTNKKAINTPTWSYFSIKDNWLRAQSSLCIFAPKLSS